MHTESNQRMQIANRIHIALLREIGQGLDLEKMLDSERYARDVLLVCQAYVGQELQQLGMAFVQATRDAELQRQAVEAPEPAKTAEPASSLPSDFSPSRPAARHQPPSSRWMHPSRWFSD